MKAIIKTTFFKLLVILTISLGFSACNDDDIKTGKEVVSTSEDFTYATTKKIQLVVNVNDTYNNEYYYKVEIFDRNPLATDTAANLLSAGVAKGNMALTSSLAIPIHVSRIYVRQTNPLQIKTVKVLELDNNTESLACNFNVSNSQSTLAARVANVVADPKASDYPLPGTYTTLTSAAVTLSGINYYVPSGVTNGSIDLGWLSNSALYVSGEVNFPSRGNFFMPQNCKIIVLPGGKVTFNNRSNFEQAGIILAVNAGATMTFNQSSSVGEGSILINDGTTNMMSDFEIRANSVVYNNGSLNGTDFTMTNNSTFKNNSTVSFSNKFTMNSNTNFTNNGTFEAVGSIVTNNTTAVITNNNLLKTAYYNMLKGGGYLQNNCKVICSDFATEGATVNSSAGTLISCKNFYANNTNITLTGDALFRTGVNTANAGSNINTGVTFNYGVTLNGVVSNSKSPMFIVSGLNNKNSWQVLALAGTMEFVISSTDTPSNNFYKTIASGVSFTETPTMTIESTDCNGGGVNASTGSGTPSNPTFPMVITESNQYTFAMEDLWPNLGDYDMNDFVFKISNITKTINSENKVLEMTFDIKPMAAGSTKKISAGLQFDNINSGSISLTSTNSVGKIESDQTKANILLFENIHSLFGKTSPVITNTYAHTAKVETGSYNFAVSFQTPVSNDDVIISNMNFYVIVGDVDSSDRKEVHLAGNSPSSKVKTATNNYKDSNNMVWAIMLPVGDFQYPTELTKIYNAYPQFNAWATSSGASNTNWYLSPSTTVGLVYTK